MRQHEPLELRRDVPLVPPPVDSDETGLRFRKQPSGGRGEYEFVGSQDGISSRAFEGKVIFLKTSNGLKDTRMYLGNQGGKQRLRLFDPHADIHIQRQLAALAMLPKSTRSEDRVSLALPILLKDRYILDASVNLITHSTHAVVVEPTSLLARSSDIHDEASKTRLNFASREKELDQLAARAGALPRELRLAVQAHRNLILRSNIGKDAEQAVAHIMGLVSVMDVEYLPGADPLPVLLLLAGAKTDELDIPTPALTPANDLAIKRRSAHIYRMRRMRGPSASRFRVDIQSAYDYRCAFCGLRAPASPGRAVAGVDAAHILPWGQYDLDVPQNGLMLCKQHHWAFDNQILMLGSVAGSYFVSFSEDARQVLQDDAFTIEILKRATGRIPDAWLPSVKLRPSAHYITELYSATT